MFKTFSFTPADDKTTGYKTGATGAGPFATTTTSAGDSMAHLTSLTSTANLSAITMTVTGTDADGWPQTEDIKGPNNNTVAGSKYFKTVTSVAAGSTLGANTMDIGYADGCISQTIPLNRYQNQFQVSLSTEISGTINYTIQHLFKNAYASRADIASSTYPAQKTWFNHDILVSLTANKDSNYAFPCQATRIKVNSSTAGATIALTVDQGHGDE